MSYGPHPNDFLLAECEFSGFVLIPGSYRQMDSSSMRTTLRLYTWTI